METHSLPQRLALTPTLDTIRYAIFRLAYATRGTVIRWCLAFANFLERGQAHGITRAASAKGLGPPVGVTIPPPTFPSPDRRHSPLPRTQSSDLGADLRSLTGSGGGKNGSIVTPGHSEDPTIRVSESELMYEDFDSAPTAVYHAIPTLDGRPRGAHRRAPAIRTEIVQGDVLITSK